MAKSMYPNAVDIRELVTAEHVAKRGGVSEELARAVVDAHLFGAVAVAASGATVVFASGAIFGPQDCSVARYLRTEACPVLDTSSEDENLASLVKSDLPSRTPIPRYDPVDEQELEELSLNLALARRPDLDRSALSAALEAWWELIAEFAERAALGMERTDVVLRRSWNEQEKEFENWLEHNLSSIVRGDFEVVKRQWRTPIGTVADLLCRVTRSETDEFEVGDLLVIENKAGETVPGAVVQLSGYVEQAEAVYPGVQVYGWLASTTIGESTDAAAAAAGFPTWTWGELGFLDHLWTGVNKEQPIREFLEVFNDTSPWDRSDEP